MTAIDGGGMSYDQFVQNMNDAGISTTHINEGVEANFADYGNALSDDIQNRIMDSFDCEQDYKLQSQIAGIYADKGWSVLQMQQFFDACSSLGLNVDFEYVETTYISDYKNGNKTNAMTNGAIAVYTISDGMGGEIVIADANGNGALESEELFMNQILGDINYEISATKGAGEKYIPSGGSGESNAQSVDGAANSQNIADNKEKTEKVEQKDYNSLVEKYLEQGISKEEAIRKADSELDVDDMTYSGSMEEKVSNNVEKTVKETIKKETDNEKLIDKTTEKTLEKANKTDNIETIASYTMKIAEEIVDETNFFVA